MRKEQVLTRMKEDCLVAVVRAKNKEQGEKVVDAIIADYEIGRASCRERV